MIKVKIHNTIILPAVLYGFREEHRLMVLQNGMLRRIFGPNGGLEPGENYTMRSFTIFLHQTFEFKEDELNWTCSTNDNEQKRVKILAG
jgi:hypothetical protein